MLAGLISKSASINEDKAQKESTSLQKGTSVNNLDSPLSMCVQEEMQTKAERQVWKGGDTALHNHVLSFASVQKGEPKILFVNLLYNSS